MNYIETSKRLWHLRKHDLKAYEQLMELFERSITVCRCESCCNESCQCMEYINQFLDQIEVTLITD